MKAGRNDPCPCGSGKKYKKCCMEKDQEAARVLPNAHARLSPTGDTPKFNADEPLDPQVEALNARLEAFEALDDYEEQIALFIQTLDEDGLMDDEMAFDMLSTIDEHSLEHGDHDRLDALLEKLRERLPEVYAHDAPIIWNGVWPISWLPAEPPRFRPWPVRSQRPPAAISIASTGLSNNWLTTASWQPWSILCALPGRR